MRKLHNYLLETSTTVMKWKIMITTHERFVIDKNGNRTAVLLDIEEYNMLLQKLEELESIKAYDAEKLSDDEAIPFEQAIEEIEKQK